MTLFVKIGSLWLFCFAVTCAITSHSHARDHVDELFALGWLLFAILGGLLGLAAVAVDCLTTSRKQQHERKNDH